MSDKVKKAKSEVNTGELLKSLARPNLKFEDYLDKNKKCFKTGDRAKAWEILKDKYVTANTDIINKADIGYTFYYDIISDRKTPKRDKIFRILLAMKATLDDCQAMLRLYDYAALYPKIKRESAIIYAFNHSQSVYELNNVLEGMGEKKI